ncbi:hypothetical protein, partial [Vibrio sp. 2089]
FIVCVKKPTCVYGHQHGQTSTTKSLVTPIHPDMGKNAMISPSKHHSPSRFVCIKNIIKTT